MTERDENRPKKSLGERAREVLGDILEALDDLVNPVPVRQPIPIRRPYHPRR